MTRCVIHLLGRCLYDDAQQRSGIVHVDEGLQQHLTTDARLRLPSMTMRWSADLERHVPLPDVALFADRHDKEGLRRGRHVCYWLRRCVQWAYSCRRLPCRQQLTVLFTHSESGHRNSIKAHWSHGTARLLILADFVDHTQMQRPSGSFTQSASAAEVYWASVCSTVEMQ